MTALRRVRSAVRGGPLASRDFRLLGAGQLTSTVGDFCYAIALPWLILSGHGGPVLLGIVLACYGVPRTVLIPVGGILADKLGPRVVMLGADIVRAALVGGLAVLAATHVDSLAALGPVAAVVGAGEGLFIPASMAIMPALLAGEQLQAGNAVNGAAMQLGSLAGPAIGGTIVALAGPAPAFVLDAATFAVSALTLALIRSRQEQATAEQATADRAMTEQAAMSAQQPEAAAPGAGEGAPSIWALLRQARVLRIIVVVCVAANLAFGGTFEVALPALAHLRFGAGGYGAMIACFGAGALIGTLAAAKAGSLRRPAVIAAGGFLLAGVTALLIPLGGIVGAAGATLAFGIGNGFGNIVLLTLIQRWAPPLLLGRVMSVVMLSAMGSFPLSAAVAGLLVRHFGPAPFFPIAGGVLVLTVLAALTQREFRDLGAAADPAAELAADPVG